VPIDPGKILGLGVVLAVGTAVAPLFITGIPLQSAYFEADLPVLGHLSFGTSSIFDIGVYLVVIGLSLDILRSLGSEIDRQSELDEPGDDDPDQPGVPPIGNASSDAGDAIGFDASSEWTPAEAPAVGTGPETAPVTTQPDRSDESSATPAGEQHPGYDPPHILPGIAYP
jgi:multicomponent Na+:H+ antiporter subunit A